MRIHRALSVGDGGILEGTNDVDERIELGKVGDEAGTGTLGAEAGNGVVDPADLRVGHALRLEDL